MKSLIEYIDNSKFVGRKVFAPSWQDEYIIVKFRSETLSNYIFDVKNLSNERVYLWTIKKFDLENFLK